MYLKISQKVIKQYLWKLKTTKYTYEDPGSRRIHEFDVP